MLQVASSFTILLFSLGLDQAYVREYHEANSKPSLLKATLLPGLALLIATLALILLIPGALSVALFSINSPGISMLVGACLLANFISRFLSLVLRMQERAIAFSASQLLPKAMLLLIILAYQTVPFGFDFFHLNLAHTLSILAVVVLLAWLTADEWLSMLREHATWIQIKNMLRFGAPLIVAGIAYWGLTNMDKLFLRNMSTFDELGVYSVAASFAAAAAILQSIFSTVWAPTVYKWAAEGINNEKIDHTIGYVLLTVVLLFGLAGTFSWVVAYLLPEQYNRVPYLLVVSVAYPLFYTLSEVTGVGLGITRSSSYVMLAGLIAALVNMLGNYVLVPHYGAEGAAISTALSFWIFLFLRTEFSCRAWREIPRLKLYIGTLLCLIAAICTALHGQRYPTGFTLTWGGITLLAGSMLYTKAFKKA